MKPKSRRVMGVRVSPELLFDWFTQGAEIRVRCIKGLPSDAHALYAYNDVEWGAVVLVFEHESWPEAEVGTMLPMFVPIMETLPA